MKLETAIKKTKKTVTKNKGKPKAKPKQALNKVSTFESLIIEDEKIEDK